MQKLLFSTLFFISPVVLAYSCNDPIPYCKEMQSCEQAKFYLEKCDADRLDRDNDGIPCENVCGKKGKSEKKDDKKSDKSKSKKGQNRGSIVSD
ncbi:excalibur calcium-binding domain-containing protein [Mannheimia haemolytica]|uniref:excalibur calcium-binding domain-containing protein n=1 Tax=Mannheimia haemolytica TaxID=75985 RepID=UPI001AD98DB8|nr:excalibur calcium-binding domain-containing protein [Mannheimia haemolytica]MDW0618342.1 excalibur calcium-binding domain-containing protein [Mannheimia haemolytica]